MYNTIVYLWDYINIVYWQFDSDNFATNILPNCCSVLYWTKFWFQCDIPHWFHFIVIFHIDTLFQCDNAHWWTVSAWYSTLISCFSMIFHIDFLLYKLFSIQGVPWVAKSWYNIVSKWTGHLHAFITTQ
jgi:hypothetical protein